MLDYARLVVTQRNKRVLLRNAIRRIKFINPKNRRW